MDRRQALRATLKAAAFASVLRPHGAAGQDTKTAGNANATTIHVNPASGADTNGGTRAEPLRTLAEAARRVNARSGTGPLTVILAEGVYAVGETTLLKPERRSFSRSERLTIRAVVLPDDPEWHIGRMPALIHTLPLSPTWNGRPDPLGGAANGMLIETSHVSLLGLKVLIGAESAVFHEENLRRPERRHQIDPAVRMYATSGRFYLATDYVKAQRLRAQLQLELEAALREADVLVCPADPTLTPKVGEAARLEGRERMWFEYGTVNLGNLTGAPALALPCGFTPDALPVGLQLYGRPFDEARLLAFAHAYEQGTEWHSRRPPAFV